MWLQQGHKQINILLAEHINNSQLIHQLNDRHKQIGVGSTDGITHMRYAQLDALSEGVDDESLQVLQVELGRDEELLVGLDLHLGLAYDGRSHRHKLRVGWKLAPVDQSHVILQLVVEELVRQGDDELLLGQGACHDKRFQMELDEQLVEALSQSTWQVWVVDTVHDLLLIDELAHLVGHVIVALGTDCLIELQHVVVELEDYVVLVQFENADPAVLFWDVNCLQVNFRKYIYIYIFKIKRRSDGFLKKKIIKWNGERFTLDRKGS